MAAGKDICPWLVLGAELVSQLRLPTQKEMSPLLNSSVANNLVSPPDGSKRPHPAQLGLSGGLEGSYPKRARSDEYCVPMAIPAVMTGGEAAANTALLNQHLAPQISAGTARAVLNYDLTTAQGRTYALLKRTEENLEHMMRFHKQLGFHAATLQTLQAETSHFLSESLACLHELKAQVAAFVPVPGGDMNAGDYGAQHQATLSEDSVMAEHQQVSAMGHPHAGHPHAAPLHPSQGLNHNGGHQGQAIQAQYQHQPDSQQQLDVRDGDRA